MSMSTRRPPSHSDATNTKAITARPKTRAPHFSSTTRVRVTGLAQKEIERFTLLLSGGRVGRHPDSEAQEDERCHEREELGVEVAGRSRDLLDTENAERPGSCR